MDRQGEWVVTFHPAGVRPHHVRVKGSTYTQAPIFRFAFGPDARAEGAGFVWDKAGFWWNTIDNICEWGVKSATDNSDLTPELVTEAWILALLRQSQSNL